MSVFTILCHGSGGHRTKEDKELIAFLGKRMEGTEYEHYLILDGVGSKSKVKDGRNPTPGSFDWADRNKGRKQGGVSVEMGGSNKKLGGGVMTPSGPRSFSYGRETMPIGGAAGANAIGYGVEDNARHAIVAIANLPELPTTINLIGWSRGAVTALVIANMLYDPSTTEGLFRQIEVNIFAIDPVAGSDAGIKGGAESRRLIPPNVKAYLGLLNTNENRSTFAPQDLNRVIVVDSAISNVVFLPFPGKHDSCAQKSDLRALEVSEISWSLAARFLEYFGTRLSVKPTNFSNRDMLARYSAITVNGERYDKVKQKGVKQRLIGMGFSSRDVKSDLQSYTKFSDYFVNEHHRLLFNRLLPQTYRWLFTTNAASPGLQSRKFPIASSVGQEIRSLAAFGRDVIPSLASLGVVVDDQFVTLPAPGSGMDERGGAFRQTGDLGAMGVLN
jgi:hypothetical protein